MNLNLLLFLEARASVAQMLQKSKPFADSLKVRRDGSVVLFCRLDAIDLHYVHVKVRCPVKESPNGVALLMIPHSAIQLIMQSDQKKVLGFAA